MLDYSIARARLYRYVAVVGDCHVWQGDSINSGYGRITIARRGYLTHRLAWEIAHGPIPAGMFVCHTCDNRRCVNVAHLFLGTNADNMRDAGTKGRMPWGDRHYGAKLTTEAVQQIRALSRDGVRSPALARRFGVSRSTIRRARSGISWAKVEP